MPAIGSSNCQLLRQGGKELGEGVRGGQPALWHYGREACCGARS